MSQDSARCRTRTPRRSKIGEFRRRELLQGGRQPCGRPQGSPLPLDLGTWNSRLQLGTRGSKFQALLVWSCGGCLVTWAVGSTLYTQLRLTAWWRIFFQFFVSIISRSREYIKIQTNVQKVCRKHMRTCRNIHRPLKAYTTCRENIHRTTI